MLKINNLCKSFKHNDVLKNINYTFKAGTIYCIQGKNGSGKTVFLKSICGLTKTTSGTIEYEGKILNKDFSILPSLGVIIETPLFWKDKTGLETLEFLTSIKGNVKKEECIEALNKVGLRDVKNARIRKYSLGMKQRLAIAQAIVEKPKILLLDEPTNSLDVDGVEIFQKIMLEEKARGTTILIVSHVMDDIEQICDKKLILSNGILEEVNYQ
ncbi:ABC transporter ATP-binding protein [Clostridium tagluense]|uniref:ABC transporter ATP-binding protein n=1 Tax=Clostridium tagluense TaxID=360422 RepID=UPI001CF4BE0B|nr:ABC transporter ATP-binding protein [Clostridium tagluense]MCB2313784.1 ABC transporter ATP-binding protein [Clostridium tagluense]MCB2318601.1 ABC transporter ATP-binding protein [Clostridium tagluense]MCB2323447.1 ABC transporter ATP-binding protein [Clostridium tagluense]MCB2328260.1 ABC transporter ATP-binding protein [Clostridium tagluense]MCB2333083.1 ABC transporter ATP-binding protein [Clostridium tagluense]